MRAPDALERSQKKLYLSIKAELAHFEKKKKRELASYERSYRVSLPARGKASTRKELFAAVRASRVVLVGDFHPFRQSQKGFLRLVEECAPGLPRAVLGLECLQQAHQAAVNEFLAGYITLEELRDKIDFERYWPFSWDNYREILQCAKRLKIPVLALNILERRRSPSMLRERDHAAADKIFSELRAHPRSTVFALYGELHLARTHLPADLRGRLGRAGRVLTIHQNQPELYWKAPKLRNGQRPEVLRLALDEFCIMNSVPWVKLRSYLDWLEGNPSPEGWDELDVPGTVHHYANLLAEAIGVQAELRDEVEIYSPDQIAGGLPFPLRRTIPAPERTLARHSVAFQRTAYLPGASAILLPASSTNSLSEAASWLLWHSARSATAKTARPGPQDWVAHYLIGYVGSKVLNPKRKCNEVADLQEMGTTTARRALALLRPYLKSDRLTARQAALPSTRELEACRLAGYVLGERFFLALLTGPELLPFLRTWYECASPGSIRVLLTETAAKIGAVASARKRDRF